MTKLPDFEQGELSTLKENGFTYGPVDESTMPENPHISYEVIEYDDCKRYILTVCPYRDARKLFIYGKLDKKALKSITPEMDAKVKEVLVNVVMKYLERVSSQIADITERLNYDVMHTKERRIKM